jgi:hypothetical protein
MQKKKPRIKTQFTPREFLAILECALRAEARNYAEACNTSEEEACWQKLRRAAFIYTEACNAQ